MKKGILGANHNIARIVPSEPIHRRSRRTIRDHERKNEIGCERLILGKAMLAEPLFILSSGLAGEFLQKFVNYRLKVAIIGDYSHYTSKLVHDFVRESNRCRYVFFVSTMEDAVELLANA